MINLIYISIVFFIFLLILVIILLTRCKTKNKIELVEKTELKTQIAPDQEVEKINSINADEIERENEINRIRLEQNESIKPTIPDPVIIDNFIQSHEVKTILDHFDNLNKNQLDTIENEFELIDNETPQSIPASVEDDLNPEEMLNRFVNYVKRNKLANVNDVSSRLKTEKDKTVEELRHLENQGNTIGFLDDKGFYMNLNERELELLENLLLMTKNRNTKLNKQQISDEFKKIVYHSD